jgi:hypothetical protein
MVRGMYDHVMLNHHLVMFILLFAFISVDILQDATLEPG